MKKVTLIIIGALLLGALGIWLYAAPTIGTTTATPSPIPVNSPTAVTITSEITDPSLIPTSVNLLRLNATGSPTILGQLRDDGTNGDQVAGDKIFTIRYTFNEPTTGQIQLQVSAAFRGVLRRVLSNTMTLTVATGGSILPPDPGDAGRTTLEGIDSDGDGVRDDIQRHISLTYSQSAKTRSALTQFAKAEQGLLLSDGQNAISFAQQTTKALDCLFYVVGIDQADVISDDLLALLLNTKARATAYLNNDRMLSGTIFPITPEDQRKLQCNVNPDALEN